MKMLFLFASLLVAMPPVVAATITFDNDAVGQQPTGWICGKTGKGNPHWTIEADDSAPSRPNILKQAGTAAFPWCVREDSRLENGLVEVKFKPVSGKEDEAGGVVWRWKDGDNYYVARANALENNVSLYYTLKGERITIKYVKAPVAPNTWHTLRVAYQGDAIRVTLDGETYIDIKDTHLSGAGKVGVWTKADSVILFDDFSYSADSNK
ncbi:MAG: hypothetical protein ACJ8G3_03700 [Burkholderiaceae bacterium]